jgi:hypothetical protein
MFSYREPDLLGLFKKCHYSKKKNGYTPTVHTTTERAIVDMPEGSLEMSKWCISNVTSNICSAIGDEQAGASPIAVWTNKKNGGGGEGMTLSRHSRWTTSVAIRRWPSMHRWPSDPAVRRMEEERSAYELKNKGRAQCRWSLGCHLWPWRQDLRATTGPMHRCYRWTYVPPPRGPCASCYHPASPASLDGFAQVMGRQTPRLQPGGVVGSFHFYCDEPRARPGIWLLTCLVCSCSAGPVWCNTLIFRKI